MTRCPGSIDDGAAKKLIQAARASDDPFARLAVEFLARTGLRRGEFLDLTVDSVVQIGAAYWLHVPLGKLRTDRYIPLHPQLKELLDAWVAGRPANLREPWLFMAHGRRIGPESVRKALLRVAEEAGLGTVTPHQLRHTLATQAINRGMSLEAIAALLGHKSMRMTMVYAKIANRTVANEYFNVSEKSKRSTTPRKSSPRPPKAPRCASSAQRCTAGCSATATAPAPSAWTATSNRSANPAPTSRPRTSSAQRSSANATTPPTNARSDDRRSSTDCCSDSTNKRRDPPRHAMRATTAPGPVVDARTNLPLDRITHIMAELALDDVHRDALAGKLYCVGMA